MGISLTRRLAFGVAVFFVVLTGPGCGGDFHGACVDYCEKCLPGRSVDWCERWCDDMEEEYAGCESEWADAYKCSVDNSCVAFRLDAGVCVSEFTAVSECK